MIKKFLEEGEIHSFESSKMSMNEERDGQAIVRPHNGILLDQQ